MPPRRILSYVVPAGPPVRRGPSTLGISASVTSLVAIAFVVALQRRWLPLSLYPLAIPAAGLGSLAALVACAGAAIDQSCKLGFTWLGAALTGCIPLAAWLSSEPVVLFIRSLLPQ
jgi:hypothetical protein